MTALKRISLLALLAAAPFTARAALVWTADGGWKVQGGLLADLGLDKPGQRTTALQKMNEAKRLQDAGSYSAALDLYEKVIEDYPGSEFAAEAYFQSSVIYFHRNQFEKAFEGLEELLRKHPEFRRFDEVITEQYAIATAIKEGKRPYLWGWMPWFKDNTKGLEIFDTVNRNAPYGVYADRALYDKGTLALDIGKNEDAIDAFERIISNYPESKLAPDAYLSLARTHADNVLGPEWDQGSTRDALNFYTDFTALFPNHPYAVEAADNADKMREVLAKNRMDIGLFYYEHRNNTRAAAIFFNEAINAAPDSDTAKEARKLLADIRAGKLPSRGVMDWIFGRYPVTSEGDYIDAPAQRGLESMGFVTEKTPAATPAPAPQPRAFKEQP